MNIKNQAIRYSKSYLNNDLFDHKTSGEILFYVLNSIKKILSIDDNAYRHVLTRSTFDYNDALSLLDKYILSGEISSDVLLYLEDMVRNITNDTEKRIKDSVSDTDNKDLGPLGKYAFSNNRSQKYKTKESELDTEEEKRIHNMLVRYIQNNIQTDEESLHKMLNIAKSKQYSDILSLSKDNKIYRGMAIENDTIHYQKFNDAFKNNTNFVFEPKNFASSWSKSKLMAGRFGRSRGGSGSSSIVLEATPENNNTDNWLDAEGLYKLYDFESLKNEKEIIVYGPIKVTIVSFKRIK